MMKLIVLPTWILIKLFIPLLPKKHMWYKQNITLLDWYNGSSYANVCISIYFWISTICLISAGFIIYM